jgi:hypothetical protein
VRVDVDDIAMIDNVTRKLMQEGKQPLLPLQEQADQEPERTEPPNVRLTPAPIAKGGLLDPRKGCYLQQTLHARGFALWDQNVLSI